jgi:hypothetical protein
MRYSKPGHRVAIAIVASRAGSLSLGRSASSSLHRDFQRTSHAVALSA